MKETVETLLYEGVKFMTAKGIQQEAGCASGAQEGGLWYESRTKKKPLHFCRGFVIWWRPPIISAG